MFDDEKRSFVPYWRQPRLDSKVQSPFASLTTADEFRRRCIRDWVIVEQKLFTMWVDPESHQVGQTRSLVRVTTEVSRIFADASISAQPSSPAAIVTNSCINVAMDDDEIVYTSDPEEREALLDSLFCEVVHSSGGLTTPRKRRKVCEPDLVLFSSFFIQLTDPTCISNTRTPRDSTIVCGERQLRRCASVLITWSTSSAFGTRSGFPVFGDATRTP